MSANQQIGIQFTVDGISQFLKAHTDSELVLRREARAIDENVRALQQEILQLKATNGPGDARVKQLTLQAQQARLNAIEIRAQIAAFKQEAAAVNEATLATKGLNTAVAGLGASFLTILAPIISIGAAIGFLGSAMSEFSSFERTMNTLKAVSNATDAEMQILKQSALDLGASTIFTNQEVGQSYVNLAKAGLTVQEMLAAMPGVLNAAAASGEDLASTAQIIVGVLRGFNLTADKSVHVADLLAQAANTSAGDISDFGEAFKQLGPIAAGSNQTLEDMTGILAALADRMIKGGDAGTDLRGILTRLVDPPSDAAAAMKKLGVSIRDLTTGQMRPFKDILADLQQGLLKFDQVTRNKFLAQIAGLQNLKTLQVLTGLTTGELKGYIDAMQHADGASKRMADTINQGVLTAWQQFTGAIGTLKLRISDGLEPVLVGLLNTLADLVNMININGNAFVDMIQQVVRLGVDLLKLSPIIGPLISGLGDLSTTMFNGLSATQALGLGFNALAQAADVVATSIEIAMAKIDQAFKNAATNINPFLSEAQKQTARLKAQVAATTAVVTTKTGLDARSQKRVGNVLNILTPGGDGQGIAAAATAKLGSPFAASGGINDSGKTKKPKKGKSQSSIERDQIRDIVQAGSDKRSLNAAKTDLFAANLGPFAEETADFQLRKNALNTEKNLIANLQEQLNKLQPKTTEGIKAKQDELDKLDIEVVKNQTGFQKLGNDIAVFLKNKKDAEAEFAKTLQETSSQQETDTFVGRLELQKTELQTYYDQGLISAKEYYSELTRLATLQTQLEVNQIDLQIKNLNDKRDALDGVAKSEEKLQAIALQISGLEGKKTALGVSLEATTQANDLALGVKQTAIQKTLTDGFKSALQQAFTDVFSGNGLVPSLKKFAQTFKGLLSTATGDALSSFVSNGLGKAFQSISDALTNLKGGGSLGDFLKSKGGLQLAGLAVGQGLQAVSSNLGSKPGTLNRVGGIVAGAAGGAATGASIGSMIGSTLGPFGTAIGAGAGALVGGAFAAGNSSDGSSFWDTGAGVALGVELGPVGWLLLAMNHGKNKQAQIAKNEAKNTALGNSTLSGADQSSLTDLNSRIASLRAEWSRQNKSHQSGKQPLKDAIAQLQQMVTARTDQIKQSITAIKDESRGLTFELAHFGESDNLKAGAQYTFDLATLANDTQKLLDQFKDSEEAKTAILANESLKRQLLNKQAQQDFKDSAQTLSDLFAQRDAISNQNVFQRAKTTEDQKALDITAVDKQIAEALKATNNFQGLGLTLPNIAGINQLIAAASQGATNANVQILIDGATDPNAVAEAVRRAVSDFFAKYMGATV